MFFLDEAAIWLTQPNTYSWRPIGQPLRVPTSKARGIAARLNLMGVVEYGSDTVLYREIEGNTTGQAAQDFIEVLAADANPECPTVVLLDRASVHTCSAMNQQRKRWQDLGLIIAHLPAYSPELNDMEPQWRHLKYDKLPERHYQNKTELRRAVGGANWGIII